MTESIARRERSALCDLALEVGAAAPTLCTGWDAGDLVAHLLVRERDPIASLGNILPPFAGLNQRAMDRRRQLAFPAMVQQLRTPSAPLRAVPAADRLMNTFELLVHHEDLRRGAADWEPRQLDPADVDALWSQLARGLVFFGRKLPVPTVVRRADTGATAVAKKGADPVTITGDVVELILFLFGREAVRDLVLEGDDAAVAAVREADLGA